MKLRRLKLSGFKSFVDPTTIHFPSRISAVVGPNGCGKSNVVDAVRWVLGEASARHLRGMQMTDFIFNGSDNRSPVSRAVVELVFDNQEGTLSGPYAAFEEISVKRAMDREGQSEYFLNGSRCRRKDITDLFLGTGLGPRAYAIIEQGMISRIVEAQPQERRLMLEEAAGVTRYKERRKETVRRIEDTRENLARVEDLRSELADRLTGLEAQAERAQEYQRLRHEHRTTEMQLLGARYQERSQALHTREERISELETQLEGVRAEATRAAAEVEEKRVAHTEATEAVEAAQAEYYARESEIAALQREEEHARQELERLQSQRSSTAEEIVELERRLAEQRERSETSTSEQHELQSELERRQAAHREAQTAWETVRQRRQEADEAYEQAREAAQTPAQEVRLQEERARQAEERCNALARRQAELDTELDSVRHALAELDTENTRVALEEAEARYQEAEHALETAEAELNRSERAREEATEARNQARHQRAHTGARLESLQALERRAEDLDTGVQGLLERVGHDRDRLLGGYLEVEAGWEAAVEELLAERLHALVSPSHQWPAELAWVQEQTGGRYPLVRYPDGADPPSRPEGEGLLAKLRVDGRLWPVVAEWLSGVYPADDLETALHRAHQLTSGGCYVTPQGDRIGRDWAVVQRGDTVEGASWLRRRRELQELEQRLAAEITSEQQAETELEAAQERYHEAKLALETRRATAREADEELRQARTEYHREQREGERLQEREASLRTERERLVAEAEQERELQQTAQEAAQEARIQAEAADRHCEEAQQRRDALRAEEEAAQEAEQRAREALHTIQSELQGREAAQAEARRHTEWAEAELAKRRQQLVDLDQELAAHSNPESPVRERLDQVLSQRTAAEQELQTRRTAAEEIQTALDGAEQRRRAAEQQVESYRSTLETERREYNKLEVRVEELETRMQELGVSEQECLAELSEGAQSEALERQRNELQRQIEALGPVNLAAIEECDQVGQRKQHLDAQATDLEEALQTLDHAIQRIDNETRTRFQETFTAADAGFRRLFPRLFGGGRAYLQLTEDDPLESGVEVLAQPPGKRIRSIQLLSGGEKALTAVALTFALFQLNPAPFCILDEVDSPLDDANIGRYGELLQEMAETTQFMLITHNKGSMEGAERLIGVTMAEPGVSRVVAVNVDEGIAIAQGHQPDWIDHSAPAD